MTPFPSLQTYLWPGSIYLGAEAARLVGEQVKMLGASHAFLLTDPGVEAAGLIVPVQEALTTSNVSFSFYDQVVANPDIASVDAAAAAFRDGGADIIVGLGGGSVLDTAKAVRMLLGGPVSASVADYSGLCSDHPLPVPTVRDMPPMIAIPTTAGTGSEVTPWAVITHSQAHHKFGVGDATLLPDVALIDPELMAGMPVGLTAATGLDALSHLIEAYVSIRRQPVLDPLILRGISLIGQNLRLAVGQGGNVGARLAMAEASMLGGIAISSNWLGACHSLAHQLSSFANIHHGVAIALMLPLQMAYSLPGALERYAEIGQALAPQRRPANQLRQRARHAVHAVQQLIDDVGLPQSLEEVGVGADLIPAMAESAYHNDLNHTTNPWPVTQKTLAELYRQALD